MTQHPAKVTLLALSLTALAPTTAQDLEAASKALKMISEFAGSICNSPSMKGQATSASVQGTARAEASKLVKRLADLKIEGAATFKTEDYEGLLQKDLLPALADSARCKQRIYDDLKDRFLPPPKRTGGNSLPELPQRLTAEGTSEATVHISASPHPRKVAINAVALARTRSIGGCMRIEVRGLGEPCFSRMAYRNPDTGPDLRAVQSCTGLIPPNVPATVVAVAPNGGSFSCPGTDGVSLAIEVQLSPI